MSKQRGIVLPGNRPTRLSAKMVMLTYELAQWLTDETQCIAYDYERTLTSREIDDMCDIIRTGRWLDDESTITIGIRKDYDGIHQRFNGQRRALARLRLGPDRKYDVRVKLATYEIRNQPQADWLYRQFDNKQSEAPRTHAELVQGVVAGAVTNGDKLQVKARTKLEAGFRCWISQSFDRDSRGWSLDEVESMLHDPAYSKHLPAAARITKKLVASRKVHQWAERTPTYAAVFELCANAPIAKVEKFFDLMIADLFTTTDHPARICLHHLRKTSLRQSKSTTKHELPSQQYGKIIKCFDAFQQGKKLSRVPVVQRGTWVEL